MVSNELADKYFGEQNSDSQIVSNVSNQGETLNEITQMNEKFKAKEVVLQIKF